MIEFFQALGFLGFYTVYSFIVGAIAVFGLLRKFKQGWIVNAVASYILGFILVSVSPLGAIIAAAFIRLILEGITSSFRIEEQQFVIIEKKGINLIGIAVGLLFVLSIAAAILAPPMEVEWYKMNNVEVVQLSSATGTAVTDLIWDDIKGNRVVSQEYALQIPKTLVTETGWRLSRDWDGIYPVNNTLRWIMVYEPDKLINVANPSPAYISVNAEDPGDRIKIKEHIRYSEERSGLVDLIYQIFTGGIKDVKFIYWLNYPYLEHGDTIFTHDYDGNPAWIAPAKFWWPSPFITLFYEEQVGVTVLDNQGTVSFYTTEQIASGQAPKWLESQILIDEDYTERRINIWAKYAQWKGFINYYFQHENVFEQASDLYFQYDKPNNRNYALVQLEPEGVKRKAITHFIEIESSTNNFGKITIYDARQLELIGPRRALDDVRGQISLYSDWWATQPLFKKIKNSYFYVIPVYSGGREATVLRAVAVVDAKNEQVKLFQWGDIGFEESAQEPINQTPTETDCKIISTEKVDGKTRIVLECE
jgi:hypothetical protein